MGSNLAAGLDFYKLTMGQLITQKHSKRQVTFTFQNRSKGIKLDNFLKLEELREEIENYTRASFDQKTSSYYKNYFSPKYLDFLNNLRLPEVFISTGRAGELQIETSGDWQEVTYWETVILGLVNEHFAKNFMAVYELNPNEVKATGRQRLEEKIAVLRQHPEITFSDFGTRRRFSAEWQRTVLQVLATELPETFQGTSNVALAAELGLAPVGTFAHEMPMVYGALAHREGKNPLLGQNEFLSDWFDMYGTKLGIALTDTFTTNAFLASAPPEVLANWGGVRHDSADPFAFGDQMIAAYKVRGIDPLTKTIVFSDALDLPLILRLAEYFQGRINYTFGWGTNLTNDLGLPVPSIVMKATNVDGWHTVKLSDVTGKNTGPKGWVEQYVELVA